MSLLAAIKLFKAAGGSVDIPRRTGELVFSHPKTPLTCRVNGRRKDATRVLLRYLRRLDILPGEKRQCA